LKRVDFNAWQAEELDQDQDQNWIIDPRNVEVFGSWIG
jgi:hypothetical protein